MNIFKDAKILAQPKKQLSDHCRKALIELLPEERQSDFEKALLEHPEWDASTLLAEFL